MGLELLPILLLFLERAVIGYSDASFSLFFCMVGVGLKFVVLVFTFFKKIIGLMRVLMFGWEFPPHITGGLGTACYGLTRALMQQQGVKEVIFVVPRVWGGEDGSFVQLRSASDVEVRLTEELGERLRFVYVDSNLVPYVSVEDFSRFSKERDTLQSRDVWHGRYHFSGRYGVGLMEEVARYAVVAAQIARDMRGEFDVIHAHDWLTYRAGVAAKEVSGRPLVVHVHATEFDRSGNSVNQAVYDIERDGMHRADRVCAVSNLTRGICVERYGVSPQKVVTVHNGVLFDKSDTQQPPKSHKTGAEKTVTFMGRITHQKGPEYFVDMAHTVLKKRTDVRFVMAGAGDMMQDIIRRVERLGISNRFSFTGFLRGGEVERMYGVSDLFVMPSVSEPFGIAPLEAMRCGVPCIISRQSGVAEVLDSVIKVDYWDTERMAQRVSELLDDPQQLRELSHRGQKEVAELGWESAAQQLCNIYKGLTTL